jgi:hypothetical protein
MIIFQVKIDLCFNRVGTLAITLYFSSTARIIYSTALKSIFVGRNFRHLATITPPALECSQAPPALIYYINSINASLDMKPAVTECRSYLGLDTPYNARPYM